MTTPISSIDDHALVEPEDHGFRFVGVTVAVSMASAFAVGIVSVVALWMTGSALGDAAVFIASWAAVTLLPGALIWSILSPRGTPLQIVGFGAVLGVAFSLLVWFIATLAGLPLLSWLIPLGTVGAVGAIKFRLYRTGPARPIATRSRSCSSILSATAVIIGVAVLWQGFLRWQPLPPQPSATNTDFWYHSTLVEALQARIIPMDLSAYGEPVVYHWFAHADMALLATMSGMRVPEVVLHAWPVVMMITLVLAAAASIQLLSRTQNPWIGPLGAVLTIVLPAAAMVPGAVPYASGFTVESPTNVLAICVILVSAGAIAQITRSPRSPRGWIAFATICCVAAGSKPSTLPVLVAGGLLMLIVSPRRQRSRTLSSVAVIVIPALLLAVASTVLFGSTGASRPQLLQTAVLSDAVTAVLGGGFRAWEPGSGGALAPFLNGADRATWVLVASIVVATIAANAVRLVGVLGLLNRDIRRDPVIVFVAGTVVAGFIAQWLLSHPGYSQVYFWLGVTPLGAALTVAVLFRSVRSTRSSAGVASVVALPMTLGAAVGAVLLILPETPFEPDSMVVVRQILLPVFLMLLALIVVVSVGRLLDPTWGGAFCRMMTFTIAISIPFALVGAFATQPQTSGRLRPTGVGFFALSAEQQEAALWLRDHSSPDDVVATNVFCQPVEFMRPCNAQSFWVAALTERQLVLGGWSYTDAYIAISAEGWDSAAYLAGPWPDRVALSTSAVADGSEDAVGLLEEDFGVRWLFVDDAATEVASDLPGLARLVYENSAVQIYQLD